MAIGFAALFLVIVGASLMMPLVVRVFAKATTPLFGACSAPRGGSRRAASPPRSPAPASRWRRWRWRWRPPSASAS
jgi:hypothetical protein